MNDSLLIDRLAAACETEIAPGVCFGWVDLHEVFVEIDRAARPPGPADAAEADAEDEEEEEEDLDVEVIPALVRPDTLLATLGWGEGSMLDSSLSLVLLEKPGGRVLVCVGDDYMEPGGTVATLEALTPDALAAALAALASDAYQELATPPEMVRHHDRRRLPTEALRQAFRVWFRAAPARDPDFWPGEWAEPKRRGRGAANRARDLEDDDLDALDDEDDVDPSTWTDEDWERAADRAFDAAYVIGRRRDIR